MMDQAELPQRLRIVIFLLLNIRLVVNNEGSPMMLKENLEDVLFGLPVFLELENLPLPWVLKRSLYQEVIRRYFIK